MKPCPILRNIFLCALLVASSSVHALNRGTGQFDTDNVYKNVGTYLFTFGPNDFGQRVGEVGSDGSGVLIHERLFMTAAHGTGWNVRRVAPFLRMMVSLSHDNPRHPATWIDTLAHLVHPTFPYELCTITLPQNTGNCPPWDDYTFARSPLHDIGLVLLARPVTDIAVANLALAGDLDNSVGRRMTVVGYGCINDGHYSRNFGTSTVAMLSERVA